jgi:hypothetical protein
MNWKLVLQLSVFGLAMEMMTRMPLAPRLMMVAIGPIVGVISGLILGLFAVIASKVVPRR